MGLDAWVMCNCWRDGTTSQPPFPREWLCFDEEGELTLIPEHDSDVRWARLYRWKPNACEHPRMRAASTHIASWRDMAKVHWALQTLGSSNFPTLLANFPQMNAGHTAPEATTEILKELDAFLLHDRVGLITVLIDADADQILQERLPSQGGLFLHIGSLQRQVSFSESGIALEDAGTGAALFTAPRLRQFRSDGGPLTDIHPAIVWENPDTGEQFSAGLAMPGTLIPWPNGEWEDAQGRTRVSYPTELRVEQKWCFAAEFQVIVDALRLIFSASQQMGSPVRWS